MEELTIFQKYYRANREIKKAKFKKYYQENKDYWVLYNKNRDKKKHREMVENWQSRNKLRVKLNLKRNRFERQNAGSLPIETIQRVYEDNIKRFGTLTCYLCLKPIKFGNDCLEHKIPISRGGTNEYNNLEIADMKCNFVKNDRTIGEYREYLKKLIA